MTVTLSQRLLHPLAALTLMAGASAAQATTTDVRVLVVYTSAAEQWANQQNITCSSISADPAIARATNLTGIAHVCQQNPSLGQSGSGIDNIINVAIAETNQVFSNSGLGDIQFTLAGAARIEQNGQAYSEKPDANIIDHAEAAAVTLAETLGVPQQLYRLRNRNDAQGNDDVILNNVHDLRAQTQADLVLMLVEKDLAEPKACDADTLSQQEFDDCIAANGGDNTHPVAKALGLDIGGLATAIGVRDPRNAFAVLRVQGANAPAYTFAHELSHLFGANHYKFSNIQLLNWPLDNIGEMPDLVGGKIDAWSFQNTVENGAPRADMYATLMGGCIADNGVPVTALNNYWPGTLNSDGSCSTLNTASTPGTPVSCTILPVLSTSSSTLPTGLNVGHSTEQSNESACITYRRYTGEKGFYEELALKLTDADNVPRNNARSVATTAATIAQFGESLASLPVAEGAAVGIDFGPQQATGWSFSVDPLSVLTGPYPATSCDSGNCQRFWNNVTNPNAGSSLANLVDENGMPTGTGVTITKRFYGSTSLPPTLDALYAFGRDEVVALAASDGFTAIRLYTSPELEITGLDNNQPYTFQVHGISPTADSHRVVRFYLDHADASGAGVATMKKLGTHGNVARFAEFADVYPVNGKVSLRVQPDLTVPFFYSVGMSAIRFFPQQ